MYAKHDGNCTQIYAKEELLFVETIYPLTPDQDMFIIDNYVSRAFRGLVFSFLILGMHGVVLKKYLMKLMDYRQ